MSLREPVRPACAMPTSLKVAMELDLWQPLAGLGLFLFAMKQIEASLEQATGRGFRSFVRRNTENPIQGVVSGTLVTATLQSSSLVGLMMLALVGAGVVRMRNALSVIFGANLGTTFTGWIIATIGFKLDLEAMALPLIGIGGLVYMVTSRSTLHQSARFALSLGLLLMGLGFMKAAADGLGGLVDLEALARFGLPEFLVFGAVFSALVQSSSATMAVTLSAVYGGVIDLPSAAAVAVGADLGTTTTVLLGAFKGSAAKKRVAAGHLIFNLVTDVIAFLLLTPLLSIIAFAGVTDSLIALVAFHSLFNFLGLLIFIPLIRPFANWLEHRFADTEVTVSRHLGAVAAALPEPALEAVELETAHLLQRVIQQNLLVVDPPIRIAKGRLPVGPVDDGFETLSPHADFAWEYQTSKRLEGEILEFTLTVQSFELEQDQSDRIDRCQRAVREAVHAAKSLKDVEADLKAFDAAAKPELVAYGQRFRDLLTEFYLALFSIRDKGEDSISVEDVIELNLVFHRSHEEIHRTIYRDVRRDKIDQEDISSLLNVNREIFTSCRALLLAIVVYALPPEQADTIETLPGSIV
jgi:phosphate:Na+ symporter